MSRDMIILCQSKSILGQISLLLEESLLCACVLSRQSIGQLVLWDIRGVNSSVQSEIKTSILPPVPSNRREHFFHTTTIRCILYAKCHSRPGHVEVNKTVKNQLS